MKEQLNKAMGKLRVIIEHAFAEVKRLQYFTVLIRNHLVLYMLTNSTLFILVIEMSFFCNKNPVGK